MPKSKKRKHPIVSNSALTVQTSLAAQSCRRTIRQFHVLLKRRKQFEKDAAANEETLKEIDREIEALGGLERYQQMSSLGQEEERGGGSEKIFIKWMKEFGLHDATKGARKLQLLEVGALRPDNYKGVSSWIETTAIDLRSRHPSIMEQDFLLLDRKQNQTRWDAISLSLVLNFVPTPEDRGRMLQLANEFLIADGFLFLALPLPCVSNSRYLTFEHLKSLMESIGFVHVREKWRQNGKMGYWLYKKNTPSRSMSTFHKKTVLRQGQRNNFAVLLEPLV